MLLFNVFFAAVIHAVLVRLIEDIVKDLVHLEKDPEENGVRTGSLVFLRRAVWRLLYADDAALASYYGDP